MDNYYTCTCMSVYLLLVLSKSTLSLSPNRSSGIPVSRTLILTAPTISLCRTFPFLLTCRTQTHTHTNTMSCAGCTHIHTWMHTHTHTSKIIQGIGCGKGSGKGSSLKFGKGFYDMSSVLTNTLTDSMTSRNTSFLRYLTPSFLQDTAFVTAAGT